MERPQFVRRPFNAKPLLMPSNKAHISNVPVKRSGGCPCIPGGPEKGMT